MERSTEIHNREQFGEALTELRRAAQLGVRQAAKLVDMPAATLSDYLRGNTIPQPGGMPAFRRLLAALGVSAEDTTQWCQVVERLRMRPGPRPAGAPYRGLEPFRQQDADWFFGRDAVSEQILDRLARKITEGGPLFVVGSSGAGKSSVVQAGVLAAIAAGESGPWSGRNWQTRLVTPGRAPRAELGTVLDDLTSHHLVDDSSHSTVLVVDQYEELFSAEVDEPDRRWFIDALADVARPGSSGATTMLVVLVMRADFFQRASDYPLLANALGEGPVVVGLMTEHELTEVVTGPAARGEVKIQNGLLELLLSELNPLASVSQSNAGTLPLLSHALRMTWERRERNQLTIKAYRESGGIRKAVAQTAEQIFTGLDTHERALARNIFLRLVHTGDGTPDTRRRVALNEFADPDESGTTASVLDRFVQGRLLAVSEDGVQITHEALISAWPRLEAWLNDDREGHTLHRRVAAAARVWATNDENQDHLYRGSVLEAVRDLGTRMAGRMELNSLEHRFIEASVSHERQQEQLRRRRVRRRRTLWATAAAVVVVLSATVTYAVTQTVANERERVVTQSKELAVQADRFRTSDVSLSAQLALASYQISPTPQARASVLDAAAEPLATRMLGPLRVLQTLALSPDGRYLATAGALGEIQIWDLRDRAHPVKSGPPFSHDEDTIFSLAYSPGGELLLAGGAGGVVHVWRTQDARTAAPLTGMQNTVYSIAFHPNGTLVAVGAADKTVRLFDLTDPERPKPLGDPLTGFTGYVQSVSFSPDGRTLAAGSADGTARLWHVEDPSHPVSRSTLTGATGRIYATAFSPDGKTLAVGDSDKVVMLWDVSDSMHPVPAEIRLTEATGRINAIAFAPDNKTVAVGSSDSSARLWSTSTGRLIATLPHPGPVTDIEFLDGGERLVTVAADGVARGWLIPGQLIGDRAETVFNLTYADTGRLAVSSGQAPHSTELWETTDHFRPRRHSPGIAAVSAGKSFAGSVGLSPDGRLLASGTDDGHVELFDVTEPGSPKQSGPPLRVGSSLIQTVAFSPDGRFLAAAGDDSTVGLWDLRSGVPSAVGILEGPTNSVFSVAFSADSRLLAAASLDGKVWPWELSGSKPTSLAPLGGFSSYAHAVAFSPKGRILAAGSADKTVRIWDLRDPHKPKSIGAPLVGATNYVYSVSFSPDGRVLAIGSSDHTVWLWNLTDPESPTWLATLSAAKDSVFVVTFSRDGRTLAAGTAEPSVRLWLLDPDDAADAICAVVGERITREEWKRYVPGRPYDPPC